MRRTCAITEADSAVRSPEVRTTIADEGSGDCANETYVVGSALGANAEDLMSPTTPTTCRSGSALSGGPSRTCLPMGSRPGQLSRAMRSLMTTTAGASGPSVAERKRPFSRGTRKTEKTSGVATCSSVYGVSPAVVVTRPSTRYSAHVEFQLDGRLLMQAADLTPGSARNSRMTRS